MIWPQTESVPEIGKNLLSRCKFKCEYNLNDFSLLFERLYCTHSNNVKTSAIWFPYFLWCCRFSNNRLRILLESFSNSDCLILNNNRNSSFKQSHILPKDPFEEMLFEVKTYNPLDRCKSGSRSSRDPGFGSSSDWMSYCSLGPWAELSHQACTLSCVKQWKHRPGGTAFSSRTNRLPGRTRYTTLCCFSPRWASLNDTFLAIIDSWGGGVGAATCVLINEINIHAADTWEITHKLQAGLFYLEC